MDQTLADLEDDRFQRKSSLLETMIDYVSILTTMWKGYRIYFVGNIRLHLECVVQQSVGSRPVRGYSAVLTLCLSQYQHLPEHTFYQTTTQEQFTMRISGSRPDRVSYRQSH